MLKPNMFKIPLNNMRGKMFESIGKYATNITRPNPFL